MVTKGIKKGKLPPIKTPKQLDVFVFGERRKSALALKGDQLNENGVAGLVATGSESLTMGTKGMFNTVTTEEKESSSKE